MNRKALVASASLFFLLSQAGGASAQDAPPLPAQPPSAQGAPAPPAPASPAPPAIASVAPFGAFAPTLFAGDNFLGVEAEEVTDKNLSRYGLRGEARGVGIVRVLKGSPAERAGLRENDVIVRFDGEAVTSVRKLNRLIDESSPEQTARLTVVRNNSEQELSATLGRREGFAQAFGGETLFPPAQVEEFRRRAEEMSARSGESRRYSDDVRRQVEELRRNNPGAFTMNLTGSRRIGVATTSLGEQLSEYFGVSRGLLVSSVERNSPADKAGLKAGDVIVEVDGEQVTEMGGLSSAINRRQEGEVTLTVVRNKKRRNFKVTPERRAMTPLNITPGSFMLPPVATVAPRVLSELRLAPAARVAPRIVAPRRITPRRIQAPRAPGRAVL